MNITIESLTKTYGQQTAVDAISFEVKTGEILGFLGPNGAGKTTTMKTIANFLEVQDGDILFNNQSIKLHGQELRKHIGYLPENNPLYGDMPVIEYLEFCGELHGLSGTNLQQRIKEMVKVCGLNEEKHKKIEELSKGYRQRVGLAQAMIHNPAVLILDEPTTGLDPNQIVEIRNLIKKIGKEKTVILSTHILPEVEATCDRILIINKGKIVADGTADQLKKRASNANYFKIKLLGENLEKFKSSAESLSSVTSVSVLDESQNTFNIYCNQDPNFSKDLFNLCVENRWVIEELVPAATSLEDIFRGLTL